MRNRLLYMAPARKIRDAADIPALQPQRIRNSLMCFPCLGSLANETDQGICQCCAMMFLAFLAPMPCHILHILCSGAPIQIAQCIVTGIAVFMARFFANGTWANKCFQDQAMDIACMVPSESDNPSIIVQRWRFTSPRFQAPPCWAHSPSIVTARPYRPIRADAIPRMPSNVFVTYRPDRFYPREGELRAILA